MKLVKKTTQSAMKVLVISLVLCSFSARAFIFPPLKKEIETENKIDTLNKIKTETHIYSYPMVNQNGFLGTYVEKYVYDFKGRIVSKTQTKLNIPYIGCGDVHYITATKTHFNTEGDIVLVNKTKKLSEGVYVLKDVQYKYNRDGKKVKHDNLHRISTVQGYKRPSKVQLFLHSLKK